MIKLFENSWDSEFFELKTGSLLIEGEISEADLLSSLNHAKEIYKLMYIISTSTKIILPPEFAESCSYIDDRIIFSKEIHIDSQTHHNIGVLPDFSDINKLYGLAYISGQYSRYKMDSKFPETKFKELYRKMIDNTIYKDFADKIFVYDPKLMKGFVTVKLFEGYAKVGLIGVNPEYQGQGIGRELIKAAEKYCFDEGCSTLEILTQAINTGAVKFYQANGYEIVKRDFIYHLWFNKADD